MYFEKFKKSIFFKIHFEKIKSAFNKTHILFDGLYSSSIGYFDKLLSIHDIKFDAIHMYHDKNFGGGMPEPKPQYMKEAIEYVKKKFEDRKVGSYDDRQNIEDGISSYPLTFLPSSYVAFANDGDADRFGVINEDGEYVTPNEIMAILLMHLKRNKGYSGCFVKTVAGSQMLDIVSQKLGIEVVETPVGFKHVGEAMRQYNPIIAGEESGGLSIQGHIPEKDGIIANLLVLEAMAMENKTLVELQKELYDIVEIKLFQDRLDYKFADKKIMDKDEIKDYSSDDSASSTVSASTSSSTSAFASSAEVEEDVEGHTHHLR